MERRLTTSAGMALSLILSMLLVGAVLMLLLAGCGRGAPTSGTVYNKQHYESYTWLMHQCYAYDPKTGACTVWGYVPITEPERWKLCLKTEDDRGRPWTGCREVDHATFDRVHVGDHYTAVKS